MTEIIIDNFIYDITNFKHPGGSVINYMTHGQNASEAYNEFHFRSKRANAILKSLPKRDLLTPHLTDTDMLKDFKIFRQSLIDRGFFKPNLYNVIYRIIELCIIFLLATYMIPKSWLLACVLYGLFGSRCGWFQHEGGHNSLTGNIKIDKILQEITIGFGLYTSGSLWNLMHNRHHATPQKVNHDMDLDTTPIVAFFDTAIEKSRFKVPYSKLWLKWQAYTFLPITSGIITPFFWGFYLHPRQVIRETNFSQAFWMILGRIVQTYLFSNVYGLKFGIFCHLISWWFANVYLFGHFSLSHTTTDIVEKDEDPSWVRFAIEHSVDINPKNYAVCWIMGYLNCQVIHHLFPNMPQNRGPEVSIELIEFCKKWNIKYTIIGYCEAWQQMLSNLNKVGKSYSDKKIQ